MASFRRLPPLSDLIAFECAARHGNFTKAGAELGKSRVAISRHIRQLEGLLGVRLFERQENAVRLTDEGHDFYGGVLRGLEEVRVALDAVVTKPAVESVRVSMTSAVYAFWLAPVLDAFRSAHPRVKLQLAIAEQHQSASTQSFDVAVQFGSSAPAGFVAAHLQEEEILPVCAPSYLAGRSSLSANSLCKEALLDLEHPYRPTTTWRHWFETAGIPCRALRPHMTFNLYSAYIHAALSGQGIALLGRPIIGQALTSRSLVPASVCKAVRSGAFYVLWRRGNAGGTRILADWIIEACSSPCG